MLGIKILEKNGFQSFYATLGPSHVLYLKKGVSVDQNSKKYFWYSQIPVNVSQYFCSIFNQKKSKLKKNFPIHKPPSSEKVGKQKESYDSSYTEFKILKTFTKDS